MKLWYCKDHDAHWPVGCSSIVLAEDEAMARYLLDQSLAASGLKPFQQVPYNLKEVDLTVCQAIVINDGEY